VVRIFILLTTVAALLAAPTSAIALSSACSNTEIATGLCSVDASIGDEDVTLTGTATDPGSPSAGNGATSTHGSGATKARPFECQIFVAGRCLVRKGRPNPVQPDPPRAVQPVTLRDIAAFRPAPGVQYMEPNGWVVPGLDANFYSIVDQQLVGGTLLGQPATVRFTPVAWHWDYGDGSSVIRATKGATWAAQQLNDFDPTPTSHVYQAEGEYVIHLSIDFHAEYRFAGPGFIPIAGTINLPANDLRVTVTGAKTVLMNHDCTANPSGPGC
jgi:hypothetical protein